MKTKTLPVMTSGTMAWHKWVTPSILRLQVAAEGSRDMIRDGWKAGVPPVEAEGQWKVTTEHTASPAVADFGTCVRAAEDWLYAGARLGHHRTGLWALVVWVK